MKLFVMRDGESCEITNFSLLHHAFNLARAELRRDQEACRKEHYKMGRFHHLLLPNTTERLEDLRKLESTMMAESKPTTTSSSEYW